MAFILYVLMALPLVLGAPQGGEDPETLDLPKTETDFEQPESIMPALEDRLKAHETKMEAMEALALKRLIRLSDAIRALDKRMKATNHARYISHWTIDERLAHLWSLE